VQYQERFDDPAVENYSSQYQEQNFGRQLFNNGNMMPLGVTFIQETTVFREFGPLAGSTMRLNYEGAPRIGDNTLSRQTLDVDARKYFRIGGSGLMALRARGFRSWGDSPNFMYFGGNSEMRGYDYLSFVGQEAFHTNAELRFPLIHAMATPIGILGGIRGTLFANLGGATWEGQPFKVFSREPTVETPIVGSQQVLTPAGPQVVPLFGSPRVVSGFRLVDARASYGISLQTFALGFPVHFDWSWRTLFNRDWEDIVFSQIGGSAEFRKPKFSMWIGYDF
jgi:outer membrane protein assembly factor BamA